MNGNNFDKKTDFSTFIILVRGDKRLIGHEVCEKWITDTTTTNEQKKIWYNDHKWNETMRKAEKRKMRIGQWKLSMENSLKQVWVKYEIALSLILCWLVLFFFCFRYDKYINYIEEIERPIT